MRNSLRNCRRPRFISRVSLQLILVAQSRRILGVDPGSKHLGIGCLEKSGNSMKLIFAETISAPGGDDFFSRLRVIQAHFSKRLLELAPDEVAVEDTFFSKNAKSAFRLGIARGIALAACLQQDLKIFEYAPTQVKLVVTGYGRADKAQVQKMVRLSLGSSEPLGYDASDALAVAICHAHTKILSKVDA